MRTSTFSKKTMRDNSGRATTEHLWSALQSNVSKGVSFTLGFYASDAAFFKKTS
jgi:hypothetical protein